MSRTIYKYRVCKAGGLLNSNLFRVDMVSDAVIIHADIQNGDICIWADCQVPNPDTIRMFRVVGTGWPLTEEAEHIWTFQQPPFVWHLFEVPLELE